MPNKVTLTVSERLDEFTIFSRNHPFFRRSSETIEETILRINNLPLDDGGYFVVSVPTSREQIGIIAYKISNITDVHLFHFFVEKEYRKHGIERLLIGKLIGLKRDRPKVEFVYAKTKNKVVYYLMSKILSAKIIGTEFYYY